MTRAKPIARWIALLTLVGAAGAASAQDAPAYVPLPPAAHAATEEASPNDTLIDQLVVQAKAPGPAFWKATKGDATVWIMGAPQSLPKGLVWDQDELKLHLQGAKVLILGPDGQIGNVFSLIWIFLTQRDKFKAEGPLDQTLPPAMLTRYNAVAQASGQTKPADRDLKPILAALQISFRFQRSLGLQEREPEKTVAHMALFKVHSERAGQAVLLDFVKLLQTMPRKVELTCMDDSLRQTEAGPERALAAARGWARGDLRVALSAERGWEHCIAQDPAIAAISDNNIQAATDKIADALTTPGKAVAMVDLRPLLAQRGVIVRLKERGIIVTPPDAPGIENEP